MKQLLILGMVSVMLSGCLSNNISKMTPADQVNLLNAFAAAGCKGSVHIAAGAGAGQLGGGAHAEANVDGSCDPLSVPPKPVAEKLAGN